MNKFSEIRLAFTDTETTGLDEEQHEIIEVATVIYDPSKDEVIDEWEKKIAPSHIETAQPEALKINGFAENSHLYKGKLKPTLIKLNSLVKGCMIVGQNIDFDIRFLKKAMASCDIKPAWNHREKLDLLSIAWPILKDSDIEKLSLNKICEYFGISNAGEHTALVDCRRTYEVYRCLMNIYQERVLTKTTLLR